MLLDRCSADQSTPFKQKKTSNNLFILQH